ncbi:MAG: hypothetical protein GY794_06940 [bacterium]|nr:hypothetical protein [bacterium]
MDNNGDRVPTEPPSTSSVGNPGYLVFVGVLLVVIIGSLGFLWARERRHRVAAEQKIINLRNENQALRNDNKALRAIGVFRATETQPGGS